MRYRWLLLLALFVWPGAALADDVTVAQGRDRMAVGKYAEAAKIGKKVAASASGRDALDGKVLEGEALMAVGKYGAAEKLFAAAAEADPDHHRAIVWLGLAQRTQGKNAAAGKTFHRTYDAYEGVGAYQGRAPPSNAEFLTYLGIAAVETGDWEGANTVLQEATRVDPTYVEAWLAWGDMFAAKYNYNDASINYDAVLKLEPSNPAAHVGQARTGLESQLDALYVEGEIASALAANPRYVPALLLRARILLEAEDATGALDVLARAEKINPRSLEMLALRAAVYYVGDNQKKYKATRKKALAINPVGTDFFAVVANQADRRHRYHDAAALCREGLKLDAHDATLTSLLAFEYSHLGGDDSDGVSFEDKGRALLKQTFADDPYDVRTFNLLHFYDDLDQYASLDAGVFRIRAPKAEVDPVRDYMVPFLEAAYDTFATRYGIRPAHVDVDLLIDREAFSLRTHGTPRAEADGICFGGLITAIAPRGTDIGWGNVLYHELAHTFHLALSKGRVPRWFTEGLAEYEVELRDPTWRRVPARDVVAMFRAGRIPSIGSLDQRFTSAEDRAEYLASYEVALLRIEYLAEKKGIKALVKMLGLFAKGKSTVAALKAATGLTAAKFDKGFAAWLEKRFSYLANDHVSPVFAYRPSEAAGYRTAADAAPADRVAQVAAAAASLRGNDTAAARRHVDAALALDASDPDARYLDARIGDADATTQRERLESAIAAGADGYDLRLALGQLLSRAGDGAGARVHLEKAAAIDPTQPDPQWELWRSAPDAASALAHIKQAAALYPHDLAVITEILESARALGRDQDVRDYGPVALFRDPTRPRLHLWYAEGLIASGKAADATIAHFEAERALSIEASGSDALTSDEIKRAKAIAK